MPRTQATVCTACSQQCGVLAEVVGGEVVRLRGNPKDPVSAGFICKKGTAARDLLHHPDRLRVPLRRVGSRGSGRWEEVSWTAAIDEIAEAVGKVTERDGREALAYTFGTLHAADWGIGERFMNLFGSPNTVGQDKVCYGPNALAEMLTYGWGPTMYAYPVEGITRSEVLWGFRPAASMPLLWGAMVRSRRAGAKLIVVDPERTHEATHADIFLQIRPGTDAALALGISHVLIRDCLYDREFVERATIGFSEFAARAAEYPPERVQEITGIPASEVVAAARVLGENRPALVRGGNGLCQSGGPVQTGRALSCLIAICGSIDVPGGHPLAGPPTDIVANGDVMACDDLAAGQRAKRLGGDSFPMVGSGQAQLSAAIASGRPQARWAASWMGTAQEPALWRAILEADPYPVRGLIVQCHNALGSSADAATVEAALRSPNLDLLVVHDMFLNKTSSLADYLLPAAHWLEKPFYSAGYGYAAWSGDYVAAAPAVLPASVPSDYDFWRDLGRRFGQADRWPATAEEFWDSMLRPAGLSFDAVCGSEGALVGEAARRHEPPAVDPRRPFGTPSGKVELLSSLLADWGIDPLPDHEAPAVRDDLDEERYPLLLTTGGRVIGGFHQHTQQMSAYRATHPDPVASMHPETAAARGIQEAEWIRIETPVGAVEQLARLTDDLLPGIVHADRWWYPERADDPDDPFGFHRTNINVCTAAGPLDCDPVMGSWLLRAVPCQVERGAAPS